MWRRHSQGGSVVLGVCSSCLVSVDQGADTSDIYHIHIIYIYTMSYTNILHNIYMYIYIYAAYTMYLYHTYTYTNTHTCTHRHSTHIIHTIYFLHTIYTYHTYITHTPTIYTYTHTHTHTIHPAHNYLVLSTQQSL